MNSKKRKLLLSGIVAILSLLFALLTWYDSLRISDIELMNSIRQTHTQLERYYQAHAAYPPRSKGPKALGFTYHPLEKDGSVCQSDISCPWYELQFSLDTSSLLKRGNHIQTPTTLK